MDSYSSPNEIECIEITAEHFYGGDEKLLKSLAEKYPLVVHGLGLSLGTPGPLDPVNLEQFQRIVEICNPLWVSEHVAFTRTKEVDLGHLNPVSPTRDSLKVLSEHIAQLKDLCKKPVLLENVTSHFLLQGDMSEPEFLSRLCESADCDLLLDVTNLYINSRNHGFDPHRWLNDLEKSRIKQLHVVGYSLIEGRFLDRHAEEIQDDLWSLIEYVIKNTPVEMAILERDESFPKVEILASELSRMKGIFLDA